MDDLELTALIADADLPSLLPALAYTLADPDVAPKDLWLDPERTLEPNGGWSDEQVTRARHLATEALRRFLEGSPAEPTGELLTRLVDWVSGTDLDPDYQQMLIEELAIAGDLRAPELLADELGQSGDEALVAVIGAGMSGILAAHRLQQAGVPYVVLEKNDDVGGTWLENTYPGCRVDVFQPCLRLLRRPASRLAGVPLEPARAARILPRLRRRVGRAKQDPLRRGGGIDHVARGRAPLVDRDGHSIGPRVDGSHSRCDSCRPAESAAHAFDRRRRVVLRGVVSTARHGATTLTWSVGESV